MVRVLNPRKPAADIITATDVVNATRSVRGIAGVGEVGPAPAHVDPQVAALEKYLILADKGITILSQIQGLVGKYRDIVHSTAPVAPPPAPRAPYQEDVADLPPRHPDPPNEAEAETVEPTEVIPMHDCNETIRCVGAAQISQVLGVLLTQQPDLTVAQLKQLIDGNPETIDHLLHVYMVGGEVGI